MSQVRILSGVQTIQQHELHFIVEFFFFIETNSVTYITNQFCDVDNILNRRETYRKLYRFKFLGGNLIYILQITLKTLRILVERLGGKVVCVLRGEFNILKLKFIILNCN